MNIRISVFRICQILCIIAFFLLITHSDLVRCSATDGLHSWAVSVVPVLFPFIILSRFWIHYDVPSLIFQLSQTAMPKHPSLAVAASILFLGLASGFPVGAVFVKYFYDRKIITKETAEHLLPLCSFVSPMFLMGYVRPLTGYKGITWWLFSISLYVPVLLYFGKEIFSEKIQIDYHGFSQKKGLLNSSSEKGSIREIWISSLEIIFTIGIYMMLFAILFGLTMHLPVFDRTFFKIILANLEITAGIDQIASMTEIHGIFRGIVLAASVSFGGLCTIAQVYTIISESDLSLKSYVNTKWKTAILSAVLLLFFFFFLKVFFAAGSSGSIS